VFDLIIRGGDVIDGTGAARRRADVGLRDGRIVALGKMNGEAESTIDATGKVVAPGFIDVHTHFDAQVFWDPALTPSPLHGVTTALAGNCGFTIAPLSESAADRDYLARMLARVEGMPLEALQEGVPWSWTSTSEYFDAIDDNVGINLGVMVGHSALRRTVMGVDATTREATSEEVARMARLLHEGLDAGGLGFSSSWARTHKDAEGNMVPSRWANREELLELSRITGAHEGTSLEFIPMVGPFEQWAAELMADMSTAAARPLNWNVLHVSAATAAAAEAKLAASDVARSRGGKIIALTTPMNFETRLSFASEFAMDAVPGWKQAMHLSKVEKIAAFRDAEVRKALAESRDGGAADPFGDPSTLVIFDVVADENRPFVGRTLGEIATETRRDPWDALFDIVAMDELETSFGRPADVESREDWEARAAVWRDERALIGASDAGAHLAFLAAFNYTTIVLAEAVRHHGVMSLEEAVHLLTDRPAQLYGLVERGRVQEGWYADLVVFDPATVRTREVAMRFDLPSGAGRLHAESEGIEHVLVNGRPIVSHGMLTSERSGSLLRAGRDTATPSVA
jgi:N-acyl-D-aspartate/D-glutamate deacylase